jgi:RNA polymerase sigma factor (sigma-70 family)
VRRAREGDAAAYGELARRHRAAALRVATVVLGAPEGADDVVQQALERAWRAIVRVDPGRPFGPWLLRIVANAARNDRRSRGRRARLALRVAGRAGAGADAASPEEAAVTAADRETVVAALNRLAAGDRLVLALRHFEQLSEAEMAAVLDCAPGTVKSRLSRATARLREELHRG